PPRPRRLLRKKNKASRLAALTDGRAGIPVRPSVFLPWPVEPMISEHRDVPVPERRSRDRAMSHSPSPTDAGRLTLPEFLRVAGELVRLQGARVQKIHVPSH